MTGNLSYTGGNGISVNADDVTIDLMGFRISGGGSGSGIIASGRKNLEVRNGTLSNWLYGFNASVSGTNHRVINVRAEGNSNGINLTGLSHLVKGCTASDNSGYGINVVGAATISSNVVNHNGGWALPSPSMRRSLATRYLMPPPVS